jgi:hypothetical protein
MAASDQNMRKANQSASEIDRDNSERLKAIMRDIGWPTRTKVGADAASAAWLIAQHADHDPEFQEECLKAMRSAPLDGVRPEDIAMLEDRVRINTNRPQIYGTQFREQYGPRGDVIAYDPLPIQEVEGVDVRRAAVGLPPLKTYAEQITKRYYPHLLRGDDSK